MTGPSAGLPGEKAGAGAAGPELSLVIPAFNAGAFVVESLSRLQHYLRDHSELWDGVEVIVVDDGSTDSTARQVSDAFPDFALLRMPRNRGKGAAVRRGMLEARGRYRVFIDCDIPYRLDALPAIVERLRGGAVGVCIGARDLPESSFQVDLSLARRLTSAMFTLFVSQISLRGYRDTQCGMKGFEGRVGERLFRLSVVNGFAFDVEILYLAHKSGVGVGRVPVHFVHAAPSSIRLFRDSLAMAREIFRLPLRYHVRRLWNRLRSLGKRSVGSRGE